MVFSVLLKSAGELAIFAIWKHANGYDSCRRQKNTRSTADSLLQACLSTGLDIPYFAGTRRWEASVLASVR